METFFDILEVLGCTPREFFDDVELEQKVVYGEEDRTEFIDEERGYRVQWLVPESNENEMEPILLTLEKGGSFKEFEPSLSDTFAYILKGRVKISLGGRSITRKQETPSTIRHQKNTGSQTTLMNRRNCFSL